MLGTMAKVLHIAVYSCVYPSHSHSSVPILMEANKVYIIVKKKAHNSTNYIVSMQD